MAKTPRTLTELRADPRVREVWNEGEDGWWASLAPGYCFENCSGLHENTVRELCSALRRVEVCGTPEARCNDHVVPPCAAAMGCLCAHHARGYPASEACNADEEA
jgi:hypothetical protein